jgi:hypothetical protein
MSARKKSRPPAVQTEWNLPHGSLTILGDAVQVCDADDNEVMLLTYDELVEWFTAMTDAANAMGGS